MRVLLGLLALFTLGAAKPVDWTKTVSRTPAGSYVIGNPAAKVRLVEYMSYTCPHCAEFAAEATTPLMRDYVARGLVAFEPRNAVRDPLDLAAAIATRCGLPARFPGHHEAVFAAQPQLFDGASKFDPAPTASKPVAGMKALSRASGLTAIMAKRGVAPAALDACYASKVAQAPVLAMTNDAWNTRKIPGTPAFFLNGAAIETNTWGGIEPLLRTALHLKPKA
ncbi:DsbA family protein [Sphingomonas sp. SUN039]|uniref:DsbA family protein n=1 Tax=Sphingomonas sp. SUN039 TaxID=2937787 RepID=UPI0021641F5C|nr:DsbA family protein [Sphingomonas sp. SUN039]UVO52783.1 DsbA family protein [Sphingomonas sp. SUN039]